eukprot:410635-Prymnesium_polylepis.1
MAQRLCRCQTDIQQYAIQAKAWDDRSVRTGRKEHVEPDELERWFNTLGATSDWPDKLMQYQASAQSDLNSFQRQFAETIHAVMVGGNSDCGPQLGSSENNELFGPLIDAMQGSPLKTPS